MWISQKVDRRGFTLVELLIAIVIIGLLTTVASVSLVSARRRARDTRRLSDMRSLQSALAVYYNQNARYPAAGTTASATAPRILGESGIYTSRCLDEVGFKTTCDSSVSPLIMARVPRESRAGWAGYVYRYPDPSTSTLYRISFSLEGPIGNLTCTSYPCLCNVRPDRITCP